MDEITVVEKPGTSEHTPVLRPLEPAGDWFARAARSAFPAFRADVEQLRDALVTS